MRQWTVRDEEDPLSWPWPPEPRGSGATPGFPSGVTASPWPLLGSVAFQFGATVRMIFTSHSSSLLVGGGRPGLQWPVLNPAAAGVGRTRLLGGQAWDPHSGQRMTYGRGSPLVSADCDVGLGFGGSTFLSRPPEETEGAVPVKVRRNPKLQQVVGKAPQASEQASR